jgi:hypothetical protein
MGTPQYHILLLIGSLPLKHIILVVSGFISTIILQLYHSNCTLSTADGSKLRIIRRTYNRCYILFNHRRILKTKIDLKTSQITHLSWDSPVGIATVYGVEDRGVRIPSPGGARFFTSPCCPG